MFDVYTLVEAIWIIIPAYAANGLAPLAGKLGKRHPIDGGREFSGGRLFGNGKSWEGLLLGTVVGVVIALVEMWAHPFLPWDLSPVALTIAPMGPVLGLLLGLGSMVGDLGGSFIKRRFRIPRGRPAPLLDQEDFLIGALLFASILVAVKIEWVVLLVIITPILHWVASACGYLLKVKKEPW
ncbi:MAG: CDP-2,3-bis-(O-geranylgeranyl)-sn-glycerol synthase [Candidatus Aenigmatarchaeota archaeon]